MLEMDMQKLFETNTNQSTDALPVSVDAAVFAGAPQSCMDSFNWTIISKPTSKEHCYPSKCLKQELSQHPNKNRLRSYAVLNLE